MDEHPVWYRQLIRTVVTQQLQHNPHLLSASYWTAARTNYKHENVSTGPLVRIYGVVSKPCITGMKRK